MADHERKIIKAQCEKLYKKQFQDLEANVLAYQDLLLTKELLIKRLEKEALEHQQSHDVVTMNAEIVTLKKVLEEKLQIIEELKRKNAADHCVDHESDDELTSGAQTKNKLKRRVFKKIEHLNEYIRQEVTPEIHNRYAVEIKNLTERHFEEIDSLKRQQKIELHNHAQVYEVKISEGLLHIKKFKDIVRGLEEEINRKKNKIGQMERQEED